MQCPAYPLVLASFRDSGNDGAVLKLSALSLVQMELPLLSQAAVATPQGDPDN